MCYHIALPFDAAWIKAVPLVDFPQADVLYWAFERNGIYSMKSGYRALCDEARREEASSSNTELVARFWTKLWKLQVWDRDFSWVNKFVVAQGSFQDLVAKVLTKPRVREVFVVTTWFVWTHRNKTRLNEKTLPLSGINAAMYNFLQLYHSYHEPPVRAKLVRRCRWIPPTPGEYKVNFDGTMFNECAEVGGGVVVHDSRGLVVAEMLEKIIKPHFVECLELLVLRDSRGLVVAAMLEKIIKPHSVECLELLVARRAVISVDIIS